MRYILLSMIGISFLLPLPAAAETAEKEMERMQRALNQSLFTPTPAPRPAAAPAPAPRAEPVPATIIDTLPVATFTAYPLAGVTLGMAKSDVMSKLQAEGYTCNMGMAQNMSQVLGRTICIYASMEAPKIAMFTMKNGQIRDFELHENYKTGFPEEMFKQAKQKFMGDYGSHAKCKSLRRGETCKIFGHGYRIVLRSETRGDNAKIIRSVHTM